MLFHVAGVQQKPFQPRKRPWLHELMLGVPEQHLYLREEGQGHRETGTKGKKIINYE